MDDFTIYHRKFLFNCLLHTVWTLCISLGIGGLFGADYGFLTFGVLIAFIAFKCRK